MLTYGVSISERDLQGILELQQANLAAAVSIEEAIKEGFVTVEHDLDLLTKMNSPFPHIIAKSDDDVIGYVLVMLRDLADEIPVLIPMFQQINNTSYKGQLLNRYKYFVMGQVCIDKAFRGQGVFSGLYKEMIKRMKADFDFIITEISTRNTRSIRAHEKMGFEVVKTYEADGEDWVIVLLEL